MARRVVVYHWIMTMHENQGLQSREPRTFAFPHDRSLGSLYIHDRTKRTADVDNALYLFEDLDRWQPYGQATGLVVIPPETDVYLITGQSFGESSSKTIEWLNRQSSSVDVFHCANDSIDLVTIPSMIRELELYQCALPSGLDLEHMNQVTRFQVQIVDLKPDALRQSKLPSTLTHLHVEDCGLTDAQVAELPCLSQLEMLELPNNRLSGEFLTTLRHAPRLAHLNLGWNPLTSDGLRALKGNDNLQTLILLDAQLDGIAFDALSDLPNLTTLSLYETRLEHEHADMFSHLSAVTTLIMGGMRTIMWSAHLKALTRIPHLKEVRLQHTDVHDEDLAFFPHLHELETLDIGQTAITGEGLKYIGQCSTLKGVDIADTRIDGTELDALAGCVQLQRLSVAGTATEGRHLNFLSALPHIRYLDLGRCPVRNVQALHQLTYLQSLKLNGTTIGDAALAVLAQVQALRTLDVSETEVTDQGVAHLAALRDLEDLSLRGTRITDTGLRIVCTLPRLRNLDISATQVTDEGIEVLAKCAHLHSLNIGATNMTMSGANRLRELLPRCEIVPRLAINRAEMMPPQL